MMKINGISNIFLLILIILVFMSTLKTTDGLFHWCQYIESESTQGKTCIHNSTCDGSEFCNKGKCMSACYKKSCGPHERCQVFNHISSCECVGDFTRNNEGKCIKKCADNEMCEQNKYCYGGFCIPVENKKNCAENAEKIYVKHEQHCACNRGFRGDPYKQCLKLCANNEMCEQNKYCKNGFCIPVQDNKICAENAIKNYVGHKQYCHCKRGFDGDPYKQCHEMCTSNETCEQNKYCNGRFCIPVEDKKNCAENAIKIYVEHKQHCTCNRGFGGDPYKQCLKRCKSADECRGVDICYDGLCTNDCLPNISNRTKVLGIYDFQVKPVYCSHRDVQYTNCTNQSECHDDYICIENVCTPECGPHMCNDNEECKVLKPILNINTPPVLPCTCESYNGSNIPSKCRKLCDSDRVCEVDEYCNNSHECVPKKISLP